MRGRSLLPSIGVSAATLVAAVVVVGHLDRLEREARRATAAELARASAYAIEQEFSRSLAAASTLGALVAAGASDAELDAVAVRLLGLNGGTSSLQLARDGIISHIWPLAGNEPAMGFDLLHHPVHGKWAAQTRDSRQPLVFGPFELVQGGSGLALRTPVFVRERGIERFWGLSSAVVRMQVLLAQSQVPRLAAAGLEWQLIRQHGEGEPEELLSASRPDGRLLRDPVSVALSLPGQRWGLAVAPQGGWDGGPGALQVGAVLMALLAGLLAYRTFSLPETLRREVAARTAELEAAHQAQRRAEDAQRQSQKLEAVGLLAGGVAHDFNNLLVGILGYADLLAADAKPGTLEEEAAQTISQAAQRAAELTRRLLAFARLGHHRQVDVDVHAIVREVGTLLGRTLDKSISVSERLLAPEHHVRGDPGQLQQVVLNLAVNAQDAMAGGGVLTVETGLQQVGVEASDEAGRGLEPGRYLVLSVSDTGVGIPRENLERIFDPFFTTKADGKGTGLGLSTVYGIVKGHGGAVRVHSEPGAGSRFQVYLPLRATGLAEPAPDAEAEAVPRGSGVVLVVDDEEVVRRTATRLLESLGYQPVAVAGGQEALDWLAANPGVAELVVLDLGMPGMDGRTCYRHLGAAHPQLKVVVASGFARTGRAQELLDAGAVGFVQKPYRLGELARALATATRRPG